MISPERILQYADIAAEAQLEECGSGGAVEMGGGGAGGGGAGGAGGIQSPPASWPQIGRVDFCRVEMAYGETLPPVFRGLTFSVQGGWMTGIVGRTGAPRVRLECASLSSPLLRCKCV